ncbi:MAG: hypothetical protein ACETWM_14025 [Candidatus Lokiarchaeia archaeon]
MIGNKWMALALIFIFATAGLGIGLVALSSQSQQVAPIPVTTTETVQTGTNTYTQLEWSIASSSNFGLNEPWFPMFLKFYQEADWYFYFDDSAGNTTYDLAIELVDNSGPEEVRKVMFPKTTITGDIKIVLNSTQRNDLVSYGGLDSYLEYKVSDISSYFTLKCYLRWDVPVLENVTHTSWLLYLI